MGFESETSKSTISITQSASPIQASLQVKNDGDVLGIEDPAAYRAAYASLAIDVAKAVDSYLRRKRQLTAPLAASKTSQQINTVQNYGQHE